MHFWIPLCGRYWENRRLGTGRGQRAGDGRMPREDSGHIMEQTNDEGLRALRTACTAHCVLLEHF